MLQFLKRLLGLSENAPLVRDAPINPFPSTRSIAGNTASTKDVPVTGGAADTAAVAKYFELSAIIEHAKAEGNLAAAIHAARETYPLMPAVVRQIKEKYGHFDLKTSHAVHTAGTLMAVMGNREGIQELREALSAVPELHAWLPIADEANADAALAEAVLAAVTAQPGLKQSELNDRVRDDRRRAGALASWLEKGKRLQRVHQGSTYLLYPPGFPLEPTGSDLAPPAAEACPNNSIMVTGHWRSRSRSADRARPLNLASLPYVRLPKAPMAWQEQHRTRSEASSDLKVEVADVGPKTRASRSHLPHFKISGVGWALTKDEALPLKERPSLAYRQMFQTAGTTVWIDPNGQRVGFPSAPAVALTTNRAGATLAERGLLHDTYRADVNADGSGMVFLSRDGTLHGYTETVEPLFIENIAGLPEYAAQAKRYGIEHHELKNHVRCVALSTDRSRVLLTVVDEAWCYDTMNGEPLWGLRFPSKEGWTEVANKRSDLVGASAEISEAIRMMELTLPVSPEDITRQYRTLAMRWHPDRNPQNPEATRRFQDLGAAMELLTGVDLSRLSEAETERVTYQQVLQHSSIALPDGLNLTLSVTLQMGGAFGADWIYAANFAHAGQGTFLAGYGGRVVEVDASGLPVRVYDIGSVPRQVAKTPSHLYILTDTRLYILRQDRLEALVDVFEQGNLIVGHAGFGLLQPKRFQWCTPTGQILGAVHTRDPIRRIYSGPGGLVVETRTHRGTISGAPNWW